MKIKLKSLLPLLFVIALLAVMSFAVNAEECEHENRILWSAIEPTCHYSGNWEYWECPDCGEIWTDVPHVGIFDPYIPELGGEVEHVEAKEAGCLDGNIEYWHCAECDQYWLDEARTQVTYKILTILPPVLYHDYIEIENYYICRYCYGVKNIDFSPKKWYTDAAIYCVMNGYITGVQSFGCKENVTRAMFTTILAKIDGSDLTAYEGKSSFSDVKTDGWYTAAIEWAYQNGYAAGLGDGIFGYKENVTREQLVTFFYTYTAKNGVDVSGRADLAKYSDCDKIHDWARDAMSWAVNVGLVTGTSDTTLSPRSFATRAELAVIVMNYVENIIK